MIQSNIFPVWHYPMKCLCKIGNCYYKYYTTFTQLWLSLGTCFVDSRHLSRYVGNFI